jgi:hypothetical protein
MMTHNDAIKTAMLTLAELGCRHIVRRDVGLFTDRQGVPRHIGVKGEADVQAVAPGGRACAVECKTGAATRTAEQRRWGASFTQSGGIYVVARFNDREDGAAAIRAAFALARQHAVA